MLQVNEHMRSTLCHGISDDAFDALVESIYNREQSSDAKKTLLRQHLNQMSHRRAVWSQDDDLTSRISDALSFLALNLGIGSHLDHFKKYMDRIADAHTFYQFFGLSGEHCGWELDALDIYNYTRNEQNISTIKEVLYALTRPQAAFFHEYVQIARYEKNQWYLILRVLIPLVVIAISLVFIFSIIAPLAISEMLEFLLFFPALYLSMALASAYVELKNQAYTNLMAWWWGDVYSTPAFHVNPRLLQAFVTPELAQTIADFYTSSLKECDAIDAQYRCKPKGTLSSAEMEEQKEIILRKSTLLLEWYDVHSHHDLGYDKIPSIIQNRLQKEHVRTSQQLKKDSELYVEHFIDELQDHISTSTGVQATESMRGLFFSRSHGTSHLGMRCADRHKKIDQMDSIYSSLVAVEALRG